MKNKKKNMEMHRPTIVTGEEEQGKAETGEGGGENKTDVKLRCIDLPMV